MTVAQTCSECGGPRRGTSGFDHQGWCWHNKSSVLSTSDWPGWPGFMKIYDKCDTTTMMGNCIRRTFLTLFCGGFRRSEAIRIKMDQIAFDENTIVIYKAPILKKKKKSTRDIVIPIDDKINPLARELLSIIEYQDTEYLLPAKVPFTGADRDYGNMSSKTVYNRMSAIGMFPHELRAYRAMQFVAERGWNAQDLMAWFEWANPIMAIHYTRTRDIAARMGVTELPKLGG